MDPQPLQVLGSLGKTEGRMLQRREWMHCVVTMKHPPLISHTFHFKVDLRLKFTMLGNDRRVDFHTNTASVGPVSLQQLLLWLISCSAQTEHHTLTEHVAVKYTLQGPMPPNTQRVNTACTEHTKVTH